MSRSYFSYSVMRRDCHGTLVFQKGQLIEICLLWFGVVMAVRSYRHRMSEVPLSDYLGICVLPSLFLRLEFVREVNGYVEPFGHHLNFCIFKISCTRLGCSMVQLQAPSQWVRVPHHSKINSTWCSTHTSTSSNRLYGYRDVPSPSSALLWVSPQTWLPPI